MKSAHAFAVATFASTCAACAVAAAALAPVTGNRTASPVGFAWFGGMAAAAGALTLAAAADGLAASSRPRPRA